MYACMNDCSFNSPPSPPHPFQHTNIKNITFCISGTGHHIRVIIYLASRSVVVAARDHILHIDIYIQHPIDFLLSHFSMSGLLLWFLVFSD